MHEAKPRMSPISMNHTSESFTKCKDRAWIFILFYKKIRVILNVYVCIHPILYSEKENQHETFQKMECPQVQAFSFFFRNAKAKPVCMLSLKVVLK